MHIHLAPMEGVIDHNLRYLLSSIGGIDFCTTEFIRVTDHTLPRKVFLRYCPELLFKDRSHSVNSLERINSPEHKNSLELKESFRRTNSPELKESPEQINHQEKTLHKYASSKGRADSNRKEKTSDENQHASVGAHCPVRIQLLGSKPDVLADNAAKAAQLGCSGIDLNFGCPAKSVNRHRGGACLLDETELIKNIVAEVRNKLPKHIPLSVKIRLGYEARDSGLRNALAIEEAGAEELIVHARSKADAYKPPAYWSEIAEIKQALSIPVVANGEIWSVEDFYACVEQSQCEHIMLGRGILAQPDLALQIQAQSNNKPYTNLPWQEILKYLHTFFLLTKDQYPKKYLGNRVKQWLFYLAKAFPEAQALFELIKREKNEAALNQALLN